MKYLLALSLLALPLLSYAQRPANNSYHACKSNTAGLVAVITTEKGSMEEKIVDCKATFKNVPKGKATLKFKSNQPIWEKEVRTDQVKVNTVVDKETKTVLKGTAADFKKERSFTMPGNGIVAIGINDPGAR